MSYEKTIDGITLYGPNLAEQVKLDRAEHELIHVRDAGNIFFLVHTGFAQSPSEPQTGIIVAESLLEASNIYERAMVEELRKEEMTGGQYPFLQLTERMIKPGPVIVQRGVLEIRTGYFNPREGLVLCYRQGRDQEISVSVEDLRKGSIDDAILSAIKPGYVADILPPIWHGPPRR